jgi:hypothetical protein
MMATRASLFVMALQDSMAAGSGVGVDRGIDVGCVGQRNLANDGRCGGLVFF